MSGSSIGAIFRVTTWGESHGAAQGAVVDGVPAGLYINEAYIQKFLDRRKPGMGLYSTKRKEGDKVLILSGVFEGKTTGCPIMLMVNNEDLRSSDYENIKNIMRPAHADYGYIVKYGHRDYRGGGRSSGRETLCRVAAGAVAVKVLDELGIKFLSFTKAIGPVTISEERFDESFINKNELNMPDEAAYNEAAAYLDNIIKNNDSAGGVVECRITGVKPGIGSPVFDKLDALLSRAVFSIGAVKAVEIGLGAAASAANASSYNDAFYNNNGKVYKKTNNAGGITGGLSDGAPIVIRAYIKPTPSISCEQQTIDINGDNAAVNIKGRHDPVIAPRAVVVVEAMAAMALFDMVLLSLSSKIENLKRAYGNL